MKIFNALTILSLSLMMGCTAADGVQSRYQSAIATQNEAEQKAAPALEECRQKYLDKKTNHVFRMQAVKYESCFDAVVNAQILPSAAFPDLLLKVLAERMSIAVQYKKGKIDSDDVQQALIKIHAEYQSALQSRVRNDLETANIYDQSMSQQRAAYFQNLSTQLNQAQLQRQSSTPKMQTTNCNFFGNQMNCVTQ